MLGAKSQDELVRCGQGIEPRVGIGWRTREVGLPGGRLSPSESLAVARHSADGFGWGDGGSGAAQLALAILLRATDRETALAHYQAFKWDLIAKRPQADFSLRLAKVRDGLAARTDG